MSASTSTILFVLSNKGFRMLVKDNCIDKMNKRTSTKIYWICKVKDCKAHVHTDTNDNFLFTAGEHNHLVDPQDTKVKQFRDALQVRVMNETTPIPKIYDEEISKAQFPPEVLANVPLIREIQGGLDQARRKLTPILPTSTTFDIPDSYQTTSKGDRFLFSDLLVGRKKRMLLFGSKDQLELLIQSPVILMDGTFTATPPMFDQVYTIHATKFDSSFPCVFGLLPDRKKLTYQTLFQELKSVASSMNQTFKPERIITDYESGIIPAISVEFPEAIHSGCLFHFRQAVFRRIQNLGLSNAYSTDDEVRSCCRKLMSLPLIPVEEVENSFYNLRMGLDSRVKEELRQLLLYFDHYWISEIPLCMWNAHDYQQRTTNNCEGFHNRLNRRIERAHSNIWSFMKCLIQEDSGFTHMYARLHAGVQTHRTSKAALVVQKRIDSLYERYRTQKIDAEQLLQNLSLLVGKKQ